MKTATLIFTTAILIAATATAQSNDAWLTVGTSNNKTFEIKEDSLQSAQAEGVTFYGVTGQVLDSSTNDVNLYFWAVTAQGCDNELGELSIGTLQGEHIDDVSFVFDGASVASTIAQVICVAARPSN